MLDPSTQSEPTLHRFRLQFVLILFNVSLSGCSALSSLFEPDPPPPPAPTIVHLKMETAKNSNATTDGTGAPLVARYYELKSSNAFTNADFFAMYDQDKSILGGDIVFREELELIPGTSREIKLKPKPESRFIGVFGAFRDLETAQWRAVEKIPPNKTTEMNILFTKNAVTIKATEEKPPSEKK